MTKDPGDLAHPAAGETASVNGGLNGCGVFERFFSLIRDVACIASTDGYFKRVNDAFGKALGYSQEELLSTPYESLIHPDDVENTRSEVARQLAGAQTDGFINRYRHKDGSYRYLEWSSAFGQESMLLFAVARDVTERLKQEEELRVDDLRVKIVLKLSELSDRSPKEVLDLALAEATVFADSTVGYLFLYDDERRELTFNSCYGDDFRSLRLKKHWRLAETGLWGEALRQGRPVVLNDPPAELSDHDLPIRIPVLRRLLSIPIVVEEETVALLGVANKRDPYSDFDLRQLTLMIRGIWRNLQQKLAEQALRVSHERLRLLSAHLETVREEERLTISREVHDELGQMLTALKFDVHDLRGGCPASLVPKLDAMDERISSTIHAVQRISSELRPRLLDNLGLVPALERHLSEFGARTGISCTKGVSPLTVPAPDCSIALFRIFQEAITNIERHSGATEVSLTLRQEKGEIHLSVADNGKGITKRQLHAETSFGLMGMRERASLCGGRLQIKTAPGKGTVVNVWLPVQEPVRSADISR